MGFGILWWSLCRVSNPIDCYDFWSTCAANKLQFFQFISWGSTRWRNKILIVLVWPLTCIHVFSLSYISKLNRTYVHLKSGGPYIQVQYLVSSFFDIWVFLHRLLLNGRSSVCVLMMWLCKLEDAEKGKLHWFHVNSFSPACFLIMCTFKLTAGTLCIFGMLFRLDGTNQHSF